MLRKFIKERRNSAQQTEREESGEAYAVGQVEALTAETLHAAARPIRSHVAARKNTVPEQPRQESEASRQPREGKRHVSTSSELPTTQEPPHSTHLPTDQPVAHTADSQPKLRQTVIREKPTVDSAPHDLPSAPTPQQQMLRSFLEKQKQSAQNPSIDSIEHDEAPASISPQPPLFDKAEGSFQGHTVNDAQTQPPKKQPSPIATQPPLTQTSQLARKQSASELPKIRERIHFNAAPREKPQRGISIKTREAVSPDIPHIQPETTHSISKSAAAQAKQRATRQAQKRMLRGGKQDRKAAATAKKLTHATAKAAKELVGALASLGGGAALLILFCVLVAAGALLASPLGILFADEAQAPDTVPLAAAIAEIQGEYHAELENLQCGDFTSVQIMGQAPNWREVVAVFASKTAGADDGLDVVTLDAGRVELLRGVFWNMCQITAQTAPVQSENGQTATALTITVTAKTAEQMRIEYAFSKYQNDALDFLLENIDELHVPMGSLDISQEEAIALLENLPDDLEADRRAVVETALQLVGKVPYFWGGKSLTLGWDERWGVPMTVTAEGSGSTGTVRPFGLDCSGFADWTFYNATNGAYYPGHGGGAATQHSYCTAVPWSDAQPGDLVFYPDDSHVGVVGGTDADGNLLIIHCSGGANGVVISGAAGFTAVGRPECFAE